MSRALPIWSACLVGVACVTSPRAQELRLEDYVPADFHRHFLSVGPGLSFDGGSNEGEGTDSRYDNSSAGPMGLVDVRHGSEYFSQDRRWNLGSGGKLVWSRQYTGSGNRSSTIPPASSNGNDSRMDNFEFDGFVRASARQYVSGRIFLEPIAAGDITLRPWQYSLDHSWQLNQTGPFQDTGTFYAGRNEWRSAQQVYDADFRIAAGIGRIQDVTFAETGLFMLDRMAAAAGKPVASDPQGMRELEAFVEARRKERPFLDARKAAVYDMESVCEFMRKRGGGSELTSRAVLEMADEWNHAGGHKRKSGWEAEVFPFAHAAWMQDRGHGDSRYSSLQVPTAVPLDHDSLVRVARSAPGAKTSRYRQFNFRGEYTYGGGLHAEYQRPWRRYFQLRAEASSRISRVEKETGSENTTDTSGVRMETKNTRFSFAYPLLEAGGKAALEWYPDSRSSAGVELASSYWRDFDYLGSKSDLQASLGYVPTLDAAGYAQSLSLNGRYWISERLSAQGQIIGSLVWGDSRDLLDSQPWIGPRPRWNEWSSPSLHINAGLEYYLF